MHSNHYLHGTNITCNTILIRAEAHFNILNTWLIQLDAHRIDPAIHPTHLDFDSCKNLLYH